MTEIDKAEALSRQQMVTADSLVRGFVSGEPPVLEIIEAAKLLAMNYDNTAHAVVCDQFDKLDRLYNLVFDMADKMADKTPSEFFKVTLAQIKEEREEIGKR